RLGCRSRDLISIEVGGIENAFGLVAVTPLLVRKGVHREMQEAVELQLVPAQLPRDRHRSERRGWRDRLRAAFRSPGKHAHTKNWRADQREQEVLCKACGDRPHHETGNNAVATSSGSSCSRKDCTMAANERLTLPSKR